MGNERKGKQIFVKNPVYGQDPLYWEVYKGALLVGRYSSQWEAMQCRDRIILNGGDLSEEYLK